MKDEDGECTFHFNISTYYADIYFQKAVVMYTHTVSIIIQIPYPINVSSCSTHVV